MYFLMLTFSRRFCQRTRHFQVHSLDSSEASIFKRGVTTTLHGPNDLSTEIALGQRCVAVFMDILGWVACSPTGYGSIPINTIFRGMNIHLPAIFMFTRGTRLWHTANWSLHKCWMLQSLVCPGVAVAAVSKGTDVAWGTSTINLYATSRRLISGLNIWSLIVSHKINCKPYFKVHEELIWHDVTIQVQENAPQRVCGVSPRLDVGKLVRPWHDQDDCCCWLVRCWAAFHGASCAARRSCPKLVALTSTRRWRPPQLCQPWRC